MALRTNLQEGHEVVAGIGFVLLAVLTSPFWVLVWLLGAIKVYFKGRSEAPYSRYIPER